MAHYVCRWCHKTVERDSNEYYYKSYCMTHSRTVWLKRVNVEESEKFEDD